MEALFFLSAVLIYLIGVAVSQSLMSLGSLLLGLAFFYLLFDRLLDPEQRKRIFSLPLSSKIALASILDFLILGSITLYLHSGDPMFEWSGIKHLPLFCIPFLPLLLRPEKWKLSSNRLQSIALLWALAFSASCSFAIFQALFDGKMAIAWMKNPIYLAYNLLFQLTALVALTPHLEKRLRLPSIGLIILGFGAILATNSRMASLCALIIIILFLGKWALKSLPKKWILIPALALSGFGISEYARKPYVRHRVHNAVNFDSPSWQGRLKAWDHNLVLIKDNPFFGTGLMQNALYTSKLNSHWQGLWGGNVAIYAHSVYLQLLAESGIIGSLLFVIALLALLKSLPLLAAPLTALAISGLTENVLSNSKPLHAFLASMLVLGLAQKLGFTQKSPSET